MKQILRRTLYLVLFVVSLGLVILCHALGAIPAMIIPSILALLAMISLLTDKNK